VKPQRIAAPRAASFSFIAAARESVEQGRIVPQLISPLAVENGIS